MTKKEALVAALQISVPDITLEKALIDNDLVGTDPYGKANELIIDTCAVTILQGLLAVPNISEGGMSVTYDRSGIEKRIQYLASKHNMTSVLSQYKPSVKGSSPW